MLYEVITPEFNIKRESLYPYCVIHYVFKGHGFVIYKGKKYLFKPGQFFILPPNEAHEYSSLGNSNLGLNWIEFTGGDSGRFVKTILDSHSPIDSDCHPQTVAVVQTRAASLGYRVIVTDSDADLEQYDFFAS